MAYGLLFLLLTEWNQASARLRHGVTTVGRPENEIARSRESKNRAQGTARMESRGRISRLPR
jgi:hypothetical protein